MCHTAGMPVSCSRRPLKHCCAVTSLHGSETALLITDSDIVEPSIVTEDLIHYTSLGPNTGSTIRRLADLKPRVLAAMHGASFSGDGSAALKALGDHYDARLRVALAV